MLWVGTTLHEIPTVQALATDLHAYAVIAADVWQCLESEQRTLGFRPNCGTHLVEAIQRRVTEEGV